MTRANVLLIVFDCLSQNDLTRLSDALPNLRRLARDSQTFDNAYAPGPESGPSRASVFTGLDMAAHGVWTDGVALPAHEVTLPQRFAGAGYHTWLVGQRQLAGVSHWTTEHARVGEFAHFDWAHGPLHRSRQNAYLAWLDGQAPDRLATIFPRQANADDTEIPAAQRDAMAALPDGLSFNHWAGQQAIKRVGEAPSGRPFFGVVGFVVGTSMGVPLAPGPCLDGVDTRALEQADMAVGAILDAVKDMPDVTIAMTAGRGSVTSRDRLLHRDALNVPLCVRAPGLCAQPVDGIVSTFDLAATLYDTAGVVPPPRMQGRSLCAQEPRGWALARVRHPGVPAQTALIASHRKLVVTHGGAEVGLYDLAQDPDEQNNQACDPAHKGDLVMMLDMMIDARVALEDRTEPRVALF